MTPNTCKNCGFVCKHLDGNRQCPVCGAVMSKKITNMEQKMLSEAFMLLRESRFDEAKKAFEEVLLHYPDNAKAYWGRLRARYHITYVIVMGEKSAPTCPTRSGENIMKDVDYIKAMTYADDEENLGLHAGDRPALVQPGAGQ